MQPQLHETICAIFSECRAGHALQVHVGIDQPRHQSGTLSVYDAGANAGRTGREVFGDLGDATVFYAH
jgi:hypothetical protein